MSSLSLSPLDRQTGKMNQLRLAEYVSVSGLRHTTATAGHFLSSSYSRHGSLGTLSVLGLLDCPLPPWLVLLSCLWSSKSLACRCFLSRRPTVLAYTGSWVTKQPGVTSNFPTRSTEDVSIYESVDEASSLTHSVERLIATRLQCSGPPGLYLRDFSRSPAT